MRRRVSLTVAIALWAFTAAAQPPQEAAQLAREGRTLAPAEVQVLENALKTTPDDLSARTRLVGYYFSSGLAALGADATRAARRRHILWIIEHHPEAEVTMLSEMTIDPAGHPLADADAYAEGKKLWLAQVAAHKDDPRVLIHAARFFRLPERVLALDLLKQAIRLSPGDVTAAELGYTYAITILGITMINNNGLPMNADPVAAAGAAGATVGRGATVLDKPHDGPRGRRHPLAVRSHGVARQQGRNQPRTRLPKNCSRRSKLRTRPIS
jgi:hypothetical protein